MATLESATTPLQDSASKSDPAPVSLRHPVFVRVTHWITTLSFFALLLSGAEIVVSHPRFYWGESGNVLTDPLFKIPIPSSRNLVPTGYGFVLPDQNGWSRALHFQSAWVMVLTGALYLLFGFISGHFRKDLLPAGSHLSWGSFANVISHHLRLGGAQGEESSSYNVLQRITYLFVIFVLFPMVIWTGLALSPAFDSAIPATVTLLGGRQSARTLHFFISLALVIFLLVHVVIVVREGFKSRMRAMTIGEARGSRNNQ